MDAEYSSRDIENAQDLLTHKARVLKSILRCLAVLLFLAFAFVSIVATLGTPSIELSSIATAALSLLDAALASASLWLLGDLFKNVGEEGTPFSLPLSRKFRVIAWLLLAVFAAGVLIPETVTATMVNGTVLSYEREASIEIGKLILPIVLFSLSSVVKYGAVLQSVSDGTV